MLPPEKKWQLNKTNQKEVQDITDPSLHPLVKTLLASRGLDTPQLVERFLYPERAERIDPLLMDGMQAGVKRIKTAVDQQEFIRIYGDYDADGVSSTVLMMKLLEHLGARFDVYIPDRFKEGYGLNKAALDDAKTAGVDLIVTVDNGISAADEVNYATQLGIDMVITDHHEPPEVLPEAIAVINPRKPGCAYPFEGLAGVGVAYKLAEALLGEPPEEWLGYVALGTVADLMPLAEENRRYVKAGLQALRKTKSPGLLALYQVSGVQSSELTEIDIGFGLAPRINAAGRLQHAIHAVKCLAANHEEEAMEHAALLETLNRERQEIVEQMTQEALAAMNGEQPVRQVIVLAKEGWHQGVVGIVASRLVDRFHVPVFLLSLDRETGKAKGSARSIPGYDIHQALTICDDLLDHYGGHAAAGGLSLDAHRIDDLTIRLQDFADKYLQLEDWKAELPVDLVCKPEDITTEVIDSLQLLAPYGQGNPQPYVLIEGKLEEMRLLGKESNHLKLWIRSSEDKGLECIGFRMGPLHHWLTIASPIRVVGFLQVNEWNGRRKPQLLIKDLEVPDKQIFDHRKAISLPQAMDWLERWMLRWKLEARYEGLPGPLVWVRDWPKHQKAVDLAARVEASGGEIRKYGDAYEQRDAHHDIIFFELPPDLPTFQQTLAESASMQRCYVLFWDADEWDSTLPGREQFKLVYAWIRKMEQGLLRADHEDWAKRMGLSANHLTFILDVFEELEFVNSSDEKIWATPQPVKRTLSESLIYQQRKQASGLEEICLFSNKHTLTTWVKENVNGFEIIHSGSS